jgi:hypothetical protein
MNNKTKKEGMAGKMKAKIDKKYHDLRSGKPKQQQHEEAMNGVYKTK